MHRKKKVIEVRHPTNQRKKMLQVCADARSPVCHYYVILTVDTHSSGTHPHDIIETLVDRRSIEF